MQYFVTGATGFIGSRMAMRLHARGLKLKLLGRLRNDVEKRRARQAVSRANERDDGRSGFADYSRIVETETLIEELRTDPSNREAFESIKARSLLKRFGKPEEVARATPNTLPARIRLPAARACRLKV